MSTAKPLPCHLTSTPNGRYAFTGRVPADLAIESSDPRYAETARHCGPGFAARQAAREGGTFRTLIWDSEADAYAYAASCGYAVPQIASPVMVPQVAQQPQACAVAVTWHNPNPSTVWNRLAKQLGREPTAAEARAAVLRIIREARR